MLGLTVDACLRGFLEKKYIICKVRVITENVSPTLPASSFPHRSAIK